MKNTLHTSISYAVALSLSLVFSSCSKAEEPVPDEAIQKLEKIFAIEQTWRDQLTADIRSGKNYLFSLDIPKNTKTYNRINLSLLAWRNILTEKEQEDAKKLVKKYLDELGFEESSDSGVTVSINCDIGTEESNILVIYSTQFVFNENVKVIRDEKEIFHINAATYVATSYSAAPKDTPIPPHELLKRSINTAFEKLRQDLK